MIGSFFFPWMIGLSGLKLLLEDWKYSGIHYIRPSTIHPHVWFKLFFSGACCFFYLLLVITVRSLAGYLFCVIRALLVVKRWLGSGLSSHSLDGWLAVLRLLLQLLCFGLLVLLLGSKWIAGLNLSVIVPLLLVMVEESFILFLRTGRQS